MSKSVLIVGGSGFVGTHLALRLRERYKVFATYQSRRMKIAGVSVFPANVSNRPWLKRLMFAIKPEVVIFAAGTDGFERNVSSKVAEYIHSHGVAEVCNATELFAPKFVYLSNSYVFNGERGNYRESDVVLPTNAVGKAKIGGENFVRAKTLNHLIIRSSPVFGRGNGHRLSFMDSIRIKLSRNETIELSDETLYSFAPVDGLVEFTERLIESGVRNRTIHYGGLTKVTPYEFARRFAKRFGFNEKLIRAKKIESHPLHGEPEKADFSLNFTQGVELLKIQPFLLEEGFDLIEKNLISRL